MTAIASSNVDLRRDGRVMALVGIAHYTSHVLQLALPPLFPILHERFGVSFTELGLIATLFYTASGLGQAYAGVLVDRYGAYRLLLAGLFALSLGIALAGCVLSYWMLLPLAVLAGLGNSVFHPADLSILSHRVSEHRLGRAYAVHGLAGQLGFATSPLVVTAIAAAVNWRVALAAIGLAGLASAAWLYANRAALVYERREASPPPGAARRCAGYAELIGSPVVLMAFAYFALTAFAGAGIQTFSITTLTSGYGFALQIATAALTAYLMGNACGVLLGGFLADRTRRHHRVAMAGMIAASLLTFAVAVAPDLPLVVIALMILVGATNGVTSPSRDVLVRRAAAGAGMGSVFGFVYSGFDLGSSTAPLLFGALLDHHVPHAVFLLIGAAFILAAPTVMQVRQRARPPVPAAGTGD